MGFAGTKYATHFDVLSNQKVSFQKFTQEIVPEFQKQGRSFKHMQPVITEAFGLKFQGDPKDHMVLKSHEIQKIEQAFARSMAGGQERADNEETYLLYGGYDPLSVTLTHILNQKAGIGWTSYKHTGVPVTTSAVGVGAERFNGAYDNTDIGLRIMDIMGLEPRVHYASDAQQVLAVN